MCCVLGFMIGLRLEDCGFGEMLGPQDTTRAVMQVVRCRPGLASTAPPTRRDAPPSAGRPQAISRSACRRRERARWLPIIAAVVSSRLTPVRAVLSGPRG